MRRGGWELRRECPKRKWAARKVNAEDQELEMVMIGEAKTKNEKNQKVKPEILQMNTFPGKKVWGRRESWSWSIKHQLGQKQSGCLE